MDIAEPTQGAANTNIEDAGSDNHHMDRIVEVQDEVVDDTYSTPPLQLSYPVESPFKNQTTLASACCPRGLLEQDPKFATYNTGYWKLVEAPHLASGVPIFPKSQEITSKDTPYRIDWGYFKFHAALEHIAWPKNLSEGTFDKFSALPAELRLKIWRFSLPAARTVRLWISPTYGTLPARLCWTLEGDRESFGRGYLLACHESAAVFKETYKTIQLHTVSTAQPLGCMPRAPSYYHPMRDTLVVNIQQIQLAQEFGYWVDFSHVRNLAITGRSALDPGLSMWDFAAAICPNISKLTAVEWTNERDDGRPPTHLVEIDSSLKHAEFDDPFPISFERSTERDAAVIEYTETANSLRKEHALVSDQDPDLWGKVKFTVAFGGELRAAGKDFRAPMQELQWLVPVESQPYYAIYYTLDEEAWPVRYIRSEPLRSVVQVKKDDGKLRCIYDGIKELFE